MGSRKNQRRRLMRDAVCSGFGTAAGSLKNDVQVRLDYKIDGYYDMNTLGSKGTYCLGIIKGMIILTTPRMMIFTHNNQPSELSSGRLVNVARGHMSRYKYTPKRTRRMIAR
jgi:hypothetical protein